MSYEKKYIKRYGILDGFGEVIRWTFDKPSANYQFITERKLAKPPLDWVNYERALF